MANDLITVKSGLPDGRVALWERHPDHPGGEVFVAGDAAVKVARTPAVEGHLRSGRLVMADEKSVRTARAEG